MTELLPFFVVLFAALFFSEVFSRLHLPWVLALIIGGIFIGPHGVGWFAPNDIVSFLGEIGLVFLMFMAGLETKFSSFGRLRKPISRLVLFNSIVPFVVGAAIAYYFDYSWTAMGLLGIAFLSSSVTVIIPALTATQTLETRVGKTILPSAIILDLISLSLLSVILQSEVQVTQLPLPAFYIILFLILISLRQLISRIRKLIDTHKGHKHFLIQSFARMFALHHGKKDVFEQELRFIFVILIGTVIIFEALGLHPLVAGFFSGLVLSDLITDERLKHKIHVIGYGIFVPIFFVLVGSNTNIGIITNVQGAVALTLLVVCGAVLVKFFGGFLAGKFSKFSTSESAMIGAGSMPSLSTTLAITFAGSRSGILDERLATAMVALAVASTFIIPLLARYFGRFLREAK